MSAASDPNEPHGSSAPEPSQERGPVPLAIEQIDTMLRLLGATDGSIQAFLDLGGSDGVLAAAVANEYPSARGEIIERTDGLLTATRGQLQVHGERVRFHRADLRDGEWIREIAAAGPFDAVLAGFSAELLPTSRKRGLFQEVHGLLAPGGVFVLMEHVASATRWTTELVEDYMIDSVFGEQLRAGGGRRRAEVARAYFAAGTGQETRPAPLEVQCDWLREAGFESVDCYLKISEMAIFGGQKPPAGV